MTDTPDTKPKKAKKPAAETEPLNIHQRILAIMKEVLYVQKQKGATGMPYTAVMHDTVTALLHPQFVKHGICVVPSVASVEQNGNRTEIMMDVTFANADQPDDCFTVRFPGYGIDAKDKGPGMACSYAYKYALLKLFALETGDDPDKSNADHEPDKAAADPHNTIGEAGGPLTKTALKEQSRAFCGDLADCPDTDSLEALLGTVTPMLAQLARDAPQWYYGKEGSDTPGIVQRINARREELNTMECENMGPGRDDPPFPGPPPPDPDNLDIPPAFQRKDETEAAE